jgi:hypothetical protein
MTKRELLHVARTGLAALIGVAPFVPVLVGRLGVDTTVGVWAGVIAVASGVVKVTQIPMVSARLNAWLKMN